MNTPYHCQSKVSDFDPKINFEMFHLTLIIQKLVSRIVLFKYFFSLLINEDFFDTIFAQTKKLHLYLKTHFIFSRDHNMNQKDSPAAWSSCWWWYRVWSCLRTMRHRTRPSSRLSASPPPSPACWACTGTPITELGPWSAHPTNSLSLG